MTVRVVESTRIEEGRLVRETVETYFAVLNKNNNRLAIRIPLELLEVTADSARMQRVFVNLISNSLKHTHNGTILIKAEEDGRRDKGHSQRYRLRHIGRRPAAHLGEVLQRQTFGNRNWSWIVYMQIHSRISRLKNMGRKRSRQRHLIHVHPARQPLAVCLNHYITKSGN